ncbi:unnamed protein product [Sphagnum troendelagicum]
MAGQTALLRPVQSVGRVVCSSLALPSSLSCKNATALQLTRLCSRVVTEKPRKQVSKAQPIVAGIGIGGCEGWSQSCYVRELNGRVVSAAADNHMVASFPGVETEAAACICDTPATGFGSLAGTSTAQYRVRNQVIRILSAVVLGVLIMLSRQPGLATAAVETQTLVGGEVAASSSGFLSKELGRSSGRFLASAWTGLVAGGLHTLTGPDHLAALAPLCIGRSRLQSFSVGALWGCGHDAGQIIFGLIFLSLKDRLHLGLIQTWAARVVGLTLIIIGALGIKEAQEVLEDVPALVEGDLLSSNLEDGANKTPGKKPVGHTTFLTGIVYGLQPDALLVILPALSLPSRMAGAAFLGMFLLGTVLAMGSYTAFVSTLSNALQGRIPRITHRLTVGSSLIAIGLGLAVVLGEVFGINLF